MELTKEQIEEALIKAEEDIDAYYKYGCEISDDTRLYAEAAILLQRELIEAKERIVELQVDNARLKKTNELDNLYKDSRIAELEAMVEWRPIETCNVDGQVLIAKILPYGVIQNAYVSFKGNNGEWFLPWDSSRNENGTPFITQEDEDFPTHWKPLSV